MFERVNHPVSPLSMADLVLRMLRLEQQLDSYQRLHAQEWEELRQALAQIKQDVLVLASQPVVTAQRHEE